VSGEILTSNLPNDQDMIEALGSQALPMPLFTDCLFSGNGENNSSMLVAVERKKVQDITNCINTGRFMSQFQVCKEMGCEVMVIIVEGRYQSNPLDGVLEVPGWDPEKKKRSWHAATPTMMYSRFDQYLTELDYLAGVIVKRSADVRETADVIKALYANFQTPPSQHGSLNKMFSAPQTIVELARPSLIRRMAKELSGIGWGKSKAVAAHFKTPKAMCNAGIKEWQKIDGIGKKIAAQVVHEIENNK
jgi:ERCC4-type nuclease